MNMFLLLTLSYNNQPMLLAVSDISAITTVHRDGSGTNIFLKGLEGEVVSYSVTESVAIIVAMLNQIPQVSEKCVIYSCITDLTNAEKAELNKDTWNNFKGTK